MSAPGESMRGTDSKRFRLEHISLELHGDKTRLLEFGRYAIERRQRNGQGKPQTFNFLGFTFICGCRVASRNSVTGCLMNGVTGGEEDGRC